MAAKTEKIGEWTISLNDYVKDSFMHKVYKRR